VSEATDVINEALDWFARVVRGQERVGAERMAELKEKLEEAAKSLPVDEDGRVKIRMRFTGRPELDARNAANAVTAIIKLLDPEAKVDVIDEDPEDD
jgi:hypothetical protein